MRSERQPTPRVSARWRSAILKGAAPGVFRSKRRHVGRYSIGGNCSGGASTSRGCRRSADIRFRVPTVWELYGSYIIATVVVVIAQLLLITGLLGQRARLRRADNTIRAREASLRTSYDRIRHMAGRLINAQEAARADIARDLHDDVSQKLAYVSIGVNSLRNATGNIQDPQTQQVFEELERETRNTFEGIRRLSHDLHPATLRLLGLAPALRSHCNEVAKRQGVEVQFSTATTSAPCIPMWRCASFASRRNPCATASCMAARNTWR